MEKYNFTEVEKKWQEKWKKDNLYTTNENTIGEKSYILDMFPYPSGAGLHTGHVEGYTATDIVSRYYRMNGKKVLHPMGWDAFGLPAENYAIKNKIHPSETTNNSIKIFKEQIDMMGLSYDWNYEINTSDPEYYKWTQWFFLLLYKAGLAYKAKGKVNWCESCQTVLANEQAEGGICDRCKNQVIQKNLEQWYFKITDFIEDKGKTSGLINGLENIAWPNSTKQAQINWIGKSAGTQFKMDIVAGGQKSEKSLEVYTTRVDTVFGMTYVVIAPEHLLIQDLKDSITNYDEVEKYIRETKKKTDLDRMETKEKTGVELKGIKVINPFNNEELSLFAADYVLANYGTGVVMAVPAHDERDFEFAKKNNLKIIESIAPYIECSGISSPKKEYEVNKINAATTIIKHWNEEKCLLLKFKNGEYGLVGGKIKGGEDKIDTIKREITEETGYTDFEIEKVLWNEIYGIGYKSNKDKVEEANDMVFVVKLLSDKNIGISDEEKEKHTFEWFNKDEVLSKITSIIHHKFYLNSYLQEKTAFTDDGIVINSGEFNGLKSEEAREKMTEWLDKKGLGSKKINYRLRDWLVSRQRYWGAPIPIIYCDKCGEVSVPEKDLPVLLPNDIDFLPTGESPLVNSKNFHNVLCPICGQKARRESDTMDTFVCSSWYFFRFADPKNIEEFASKEKIKRWLPIDIYVGGAEHNVLHLLYSRFFTKVLHNLGYIDFDEPFLSLHHPGTILGEDGRKMSKSYGNVINPNDVVKEFGADSLRMFEMFMAPFQDMKPWNASGIVGIKRFLDKVWSLRKKISPTKLPNDTETLLHKTIKKVGDDIKTFDFNTAISSLMILVNSFDKLKSIPKEELEIFLKILAPFAPFITEEIWENLGNKNSIHLESWPSYDEKLIVDKEIIIVIQINGKVRDEVKVSPDIAEDEIKKMSLERENVKKWMEGKEAKKVIYVKGKLVSVVV